MFVPFQKTSFSALKPSLATVCKPGHSLNKPPKQWLKWWYWTKCDCWECPGLLSWRELISFKEQFCLNIYSCNKAKLVYEKKSLDEKMARIEQKQNDWLEPFQKWIKVAITLVKIARDNDLLQKKVIAKEIFGSNLRLASQCFHTFPRFARPNRSGKNRKVWYWCG